MLSSTALVEAHRGFHAQPSPARITMPRQSAEVIERPELDAALEHALAHRKVVLLCAPAGYGKTTALVKQLERAVPGRVHVWVNAADDDDLPRLLQHLVAALDPLDLPWRQSPDEWPSLVLDERGPALVAQALARALEHAGVERGVIVLDDLHRLQDARVPGFLNLLVAALPSCWTLALTSRRRLPLALARLRVLDELAEFGEDRLRFGQQELRTILGGQQADAQDASRLYEATRGWPVGVMTMRGMLRLRPQAGSRRIAREWRRRLFDYLASEVLGELPPPMRSFLLRCSVLRELTVARCLEVAGDPQARRWMEELERRELFVSVIDADELTLRLHDLFREFLETRLLMEEPAHYATLLLRAAAGEPDFIPRLGLLLRAGAQQRALDELMDHAVGIVLDGGEARLLHVIDQFPADARAGAPELAFARALCAWRRYQWQTMAQSMMDARAGFESQGKPRQARRALAFAALALNYGGWLAEARRLCDRLGEDEQGAPDAACLLARYADAVLQGPAGACTPMLWRLLEVIESRSELQWLGFLPLHGIGRWGHGGVLQALARTMSRAAEDRHPRLKTSAMLLEAALSLWRGDVAQSSLLREQLERESAWLGEPTKMQVALQYLVAIERHVCGDTSGARRELREIFEAARRNPERRPSLYLQLEAAFASANAEWDVASELRMRVANMEQPHPIQPFAQAALEAELDLQAGDPASAASRLEPLAARVADVDNYSTQTRIHVALARARLRLGRTDDARQALMPALVEVRDSGEILPLLMAGPAALEELVPLCEALGPELRRVLTDVIDDSRRLRAGASVAAPSAPVLSEREEQVLQLIAKGQSNKLIARELGLSPHTVKRHVARILDRTGQASRLAVADWYRRVVACGMPLNSRQ
jgi:LuxR family maltose regulon positive regulatory protein